MASRKKMVDRVKCLEVPDRRDADPSQSGSTALERVINAWLEETPDVQVVQICYDEFFQEAFLHYRKRV